MVCKSLITGSTPAANAKRWITNVEYRSLSEGAVYFLNGCVQRLAKKDSFPGLVEHGLIYYVFKLKIAILTVIHFC